MMSSDHGSGCEQPNSPPLCANGCGFFGSESTLNLCSKCYKQRIIKEGEGKPTIEESLITSNLAKLSISSSSESGSSSTHVEVVKPEETSSVKKKNRCSLCNKRVGLMGGFKCKCESSFCSEHRHPETHNCNFDFKSFGRDLLVKANPLIKADKTVRF